jgi:hypothetical protein
MFFFFAYISFLQWGTQKNSGSKLGQLQEQRMVVAIFQSMIFEKRLWKFHCQVDKACSSQRIRQCCLLVFLARFLSYGKIKTDCHPFTLLLRLLQIFWKICCVHVKANLRVFRVVFVLNKIWPHVERMKLHMVVTLPSLHPSALQSLPSTYLNCHEQISSFPSDRIILPQSF